MAKLVAYILIVTCTIVPSLAQTTEKVSDKLIDHIVGNWKLSKVNEISKKVNTKVKQDPAKTSDNVKAAKGFTVLEFRRDMRYRTTSKAAIDSGSFRLNENHHRLYLQSDQDPEHPSEFDIKIKDKTLTLQADNIKERNYYTQFVYDLSTTRK